MILTQWSYKDALIQTYTLPYVNMIRHLVDPSSKILLVTSENEQLALTHSDISALNAEWKERNMELIAQPYKRFGWRKMVSSFLVLSKLVVLIRKNKIATIHAFCTPAGGVGYLLSKLSGTRLIIDSYEPHAESMVENGTWKQSGLAYKILWMLEKAQTKKRSISLRQRKVCVNMQKTDLV